EGVQKFIHAQSDVIMHGFFARRRKGQRDRDRMISFDGTNEVMAGTRLRKVYVPNKYIGSPPTGENLSVTWQQWASFFTKNPEAGQQAETAFTQLYQGQDDENVKTKENKTYAQKTNTDGKTGGTDK